MDGVLVIDKPAGLTSHDVVVAARRYLGESRVGHTGTLDPLATGVLPLACGRATRLVRFLTASTKDYDARIRFGITTDSFDITGNETGRTGLWPSPTDVNTALDSLRGIHLQTPPAFSAKKIAGQRAYALAREQRPITPRAVSVCLSRAELVDLIDGEGTVRVTCSAGFYVRSFADQLGSLVGTGACLAALRRTRSGDFDLARAVPLSALHEDAEGVRQRTVPLSELLGEMTSVRTTDEGRRRIEHGRDLHPEHVEAAHGDMGQSPEGAAGAERWVRVVDQMGALIAVATSRADSAALHPSVVLI